MPAASVPTNFNVQKGDGASLYLSWDTQSTATSGFSIQRSVDGVTFTPLATPAAGASDYNDSTVSVGTQYWYQIASNNGTLSAYVTVGPTVPTKRGFATLGEIRLAAQQRADRVNSAFVSKVEWNSYVNQAYHELYDLLVATYEDYYSTTFTFATDGRSGGLYPLPDGVTVQDYQGQIPQAFFKLLGVDMGISGGSNAWVSIKKFEMIQRNRYVFPQVTSTYMGVFNARYRLMDGNIMCIPSPAAGQYMRLWYVPRMKRLVADYDVMDHVDGWHEYVIVDAAIRALQKEESDVSSLMTQKTMLIKRIEESAMNRDIGQPDKISDTRRWEHGWDGQGSDESTGGW
jgi:hypothetical protein